MGDTDCNSGIFFRIGDLGDPVQSGFEIQVSGSPANNFHGFGAVYDLAKTSVQDFDATAWNHLEILCQGPEVSVQINGREVSSINTDQFPNAGKRPDGSSHKFGVIRDMARSGYLGFQDHGHPVWYRNIKIMPLD